MSPPYDEPGRRRRRRWEWLRGSEFLPPGEMARRLGHLRDARIEQHERERRSEPD